MELKYGFMIQLAFLVLLVLVNAFFASSEIALISLNIRFRSGSKSLVCMIPMILSMLPLYSGKRVYFLLITISSTACKGRS